MKLLKILTIIAIILILIALVLIIKKNYSSNNSQSIITKDKNVNLKIAEKGDTVIFNYKLIVDGKVIQSSFDTNQPLKAKLNGKYLIKGMEKDILGMKEGDEKVFIVEPKEGYGEIKDSLQDYNEKLNLIKDFFKYQLKRTPSDKELIGLKLTMANHFICEVKSIDKNKNIAKMKCHHELAGKELKFNIKIIKIEKSGEKNVDKNKKN